MKDNKSDRMARVRYWNQHMATLQRPEDERSLEVLRQARLVGRSEKDGLVRWHEFKDFCRFVAWRYGKYSANLHPRLFTICEHFGEETGIDIDEKTVSRWMSVAVSLRIFKVVGKYRGKINIYEIDEFWGSTPDETEASTTAVDRYGHGSWAACRL